jgi:hypothetical protein
LAGDYVYVADYEGGLVILRLLSATPTPTRTLTPTRTATRTVGPTRTATLTPTPTVSPTRRFAVSLPIVVKGLVGYTP